MLMGWRGSKRLCLLCVIPWLLLFACGRPQTNVWLSQRGCQTRQGFSMFVQVFMGPQYIAVRCVYSFDWHQTGVHLYPCVPVCPQDNPPPLKYRSHCATVERLITLSCLSLSPPSKIYSHLIYRSVQA